MSQEGTRLHHCNRRFKKKNLDPPSFRGFLLFVTGTPALEGIKAVGGEVLEGWRSRKGGAPGRVAFQVRVAGGKTEFWKVSVQVCLSLLCAIRSFPGCPQMI